MGSCRYRRRSDRRGVDGGGLRCPPRGSSQGRRLLHLRRRAPTRSRARALAILNEELGIKRLELNGGGVTNGSFLRAGLIDEISLAIFPAVDGAKGASASSTRTMQRPARPPRSVP